ncbi:cytochrome P450 [Russula compacta]|nr:cytochrome P450 [Russula compacta]
MASLLFILDFLAFLAFLLALWAIRDHQRRRALSYPPGPQPLPVIGNLLHIPKVHSWQAYTELSKRYVFGQVIVVLNSVKATKDLLEKRGEIYSDRPVIPFHKIMGWDWFLVIAKFGVPWRQGRKVLDRSLGPRTTAEYRPVQEAKARVLLTRILTSPDEWEAHIELLQGDLILAMTYGYEVHGRDDRMVEAPREMSELGSATALPGALLINDLPSLWHIPEWLPWMSYKPLARYGRDLGVEVLNAPIQFVRNAMREGTVQPSLALDNLQQTEKLSGTEREKAEETVSGALGSIYLAGSDTTVTAILTFFVAMLLHPDIAKKAQRELDVITRRDRLPTLDDRPSLPFVDAVCKEALRWKPVLPLGMPTSEHSSEISEHFLHSAIPHAATEDNIYNGFLIPKGAIVIPNSWAILHDPVLYPEPDVFRPERFLDPDGNLHNDLTLVSGFGYGKRICPGRHFAEATLFIVVASVLSVFDIERGPDSKDGPFNFSYTGATVSRPNPFACSIVPRDERAKELIIADTMAR